MVWPVWPYLAGWPSSKTRRMATVTRSRRDIPARRPAWASTLRRSAWILILAADAGMFLYGIMAVASPAAMTAGYESYTNSSWTGLTASTPALASYLLLLYRLIGGLNVGLGLVLIAVVVAPYRRGERWAWVAVLVGNAIGFGLPMVYDQITGAIGPFEIAEYIAVGGVVLALLVFPGPGVPLREHIANAYDSAILSSTFWRPRWVDRLQIWLFRRTRGRIGGRIEGFPMLLLTTTGRRSGQPRTTALIYTYDGTDLVVVNSDKGVPAWWRNMQEQPQATVDLGSSTVLVEGHVADANERARLWPRLSAQNSLWRRHQEETGEEPLIVILCPVQRPVESVGSTDRIVAQ